MKRIYILLALLVTIALLNKLCAQSADIRPHPSNLIFPDSVTVPVRTSYNEVSGAHRMMFGENYRKDWAIYVRVPLIRISEVAGGLTPVRRGGGFESTSLRLKDASGKEWVLRSVEKTPDKLLPPGLKGTFVVDWLGDGFSSQHPYTALVVPPLAEAARVPHTHPVIGQVADDPALGDYRKMFSGMVCLLEEREPNGPSDNTLKMERELVKSYKNRFDKEGFLRARLLDLLMGDWDRHEDQWRWSYKENGKSKMYTAVPRDRDQVFHVTQGVFPTIVALPWLDPMLGNFSGRIPMVRYSLYKTRFIQPYPDAQFTIGEWRKITREFVEAETDEVLEASIRCLPREIYKLRHDELLAKLKERRKNIPKAMDEYFRFMNRIVDLRLSNKSEQVTIMDGAEGSLHIRVNGAEGSMQMVLDHTYHPEYTREVRLYLSGGDDQVTIATQSSKIHLRVIGTGGKKIYHMQSTGPRVAIYDRPDSAIFNGKSARVSMHLSADTSNTHFVQNNPYNVMMPLLTGAVNADDGFLLGAGFRFTHQNGFRKIPFNDVQELMLTHSFATDAFRLSYKGEWTNIIGKADFVLTANVDAPNNTTNYFGRGNETVLEKIEDYRRYYRIRFDTYQLDPAFRWHLGPGNQLSTGPSLELYHLDLSDNAGRLITRQNVIGTYDSTSVNKTRVHLGWTIKFTGDHRDNHILPTSGYELNLLLKGYRGLNDNSRSYSQLEGSFTYFQKVNSSGTFVLSDRIGGGITVGHSAFYQSLFLGGQGNLLGYLRNRFAGQQMAYNNLQARLKLSDIVSYILPGQLGLSGFYDTGRVWVPREHSDKIHQGYGGGLYFAPAGLTVFEFMAGHSDEGWYPYISLNFRI